MSWKTEAPKKNWRTDTPEENVLSYRNNIIKADAKYEEWQKLIAEVPANYPTLTEAQWLTACSHFSRCAMCNSEDISSRGYFISFKVNGRYCDWNVIPVCEKCSLQRFVQFNPFRRLDPMLNKSLAMGRGVTRDKLKNMIAWLEPKLREATKYVGPKDDGI